MVPRSGVYGYHRGRNEESSGEYWMIAMDLEVIWGMSAKAG